MPKIRGRNKGRARSLRGIMWVSLFVIVGLGSLAGTIKLRMDQTERQQPYPQAILILDGNDPRIEFGLAFAKTHPDLPIWISGYCSQRQAVYAAQSQLDIDPDRVFYDLNATDTVAHFTGLVQTYGDHNIQHVYLITSSDHMVRARAIAAIIFGSRGIITTPIAQPTNPLTAQEEQESWVKVVRDTLRSFTWLAFGFTGERFNGRTVANCDQE